MVDIVIYGTEKTLDAYKFNLLRNKQMFINQINNGTIAVRRIDEDSIDEDNGMNFAEFVAILSGNTDLLNKAKLDNRIMQLEKEQAIFKKERIRAEHKISANRQDIEKAERFIAQVNADRKYITAYTGERTTLLLNLPQATAEETGRELHRMARTYRSEAYATIGSYMGMNLLVRSEYDFSGTFDRNTFYVEGRSGLKYRCGVSGALPLGFVESAQYPQNHIRQTAGHHRQSEQENRKTAKRASHLQEIVSRKWSKSDELARPPAGMQGLAAADRRSPQGSGTETASGTGGTSTSCLTVIHILTFTPCPVVDGRAGFSVWYALCGPPCLYRPASSLFILFPFLPFPLIPACPSFYIFPYLCLRSQSFLPGLLFRESNGLRLFPTNPASLRWPTEIFLLGRSVFLSPDLSGCRYHFRGAENKSGEGL